MTLQPLSLKCIRRRVQIMKALDLNGDGITVCQATSIAVRLLNYQQFRSQQASFDGMFR